MSANQTTSAAWNWKRGDVFKHAHFFSPDSMPNKIPLLCKVTKIAGGSIYFRPFYGLHDDGSEWLGSSSYLSVEMFVSEYGRGPEGGAQ